MENPHSLIQSPPEDCLSHVISLTSPRVMCISAAASPIFRSVADSDATWHNFLPSDYASILARTVDPIEYSSKKELFFRLCQHHVLIDNGMMSFGLDASSGEKCYMISARALDIVWGDSPECWRWISLPDSRFREVAELTEVCWLEINGKIDSAILSPKTTYNAYLVYKLSDRSNGLGCPIGTISQQTTVTLEKQTCKNTACLESFYKCGTTLRRFRKWRSKHEAVAIEVCNGGSRMPKERGDGWMEIELGEFYNENGEDGEVKMSLIDVNDHWKSGLILQGIDIRPKH